MAGTSPSRIRETLPKRRRTRTYDVSNFEPLIAYLEEYLVPVGSIVSKFTTNSPGPAWVLIQGQELLKADYPELCEELGATFGETETTFSLPNLDDTYLTGVGDTDATQMVGENGVTLTVENMPRHTHDITDEGHTHEFTGEEHTHTVTDDGHGHDITDDGHAHSSLVPEAGASTSGPDSGSTTGDTGNATTGVTVDTATTGISIDPASTDGTVESATTGISLSDTGEGREFSVRPKSVAVYYFIKARA